MIIHAITGQVKKYYYLKLVINKKLIVIIEKK